MTVSIRNRSYENNGDSVRLGELLGRLGDDVSELFAAEVRLMALEIREDARQLSVMLLTFAAA
jgi:hypothetical protein